MIPRLRCQISRRLLAFASLVCTLVSPAVADASRSLTDTGTTTTGGAGLGGTGASGGGATATTPASATPTPGLVGLTFGEMVWSNGNGITIGATGSALRGQPVTFTGTAPASEAGSTILIRYASSSAPDGWVQVAQAPINAAGDFNATWTASVGGRLAFAVTLVSANAVPAVETPTPTFAVQVFSASIATVYGPGLWGHRTACGGHLHRATLGVASRSVRCGTEVALYYRGHELVVPVIDRGPYGSPARWDLTAATARALGVKQTATVGTIEPWSQSQPLSAPS